MRNFCITINDTENSILDVTMLTNIVLSTKFDVLGYKGQVEKDRNVLAT